jgi:hypothetical protein
MKQHFKKHVIQWFSAILLVSVGCSKSDSPTNGSSGSGGEGNETKDTDCMIRTISQANSNAGIESALSAFYNSNGDVTRLVVYDSVSKTKQFEANLNYITADSIRIDAYQYLLLDANKRVTCFATKSNLANPTHSDAYMFKYSYNSEGYLATKELFINGSAIANFSTTYNYVDGSLTECVMTAPSAGNLKVLESTLSYDNSLTIKNWIYTFPDATEGNPYTSILNFGKRAVHPLRQVVTRIYNPVNRNLIDTWTTNYGNYKLNKHGYVLSGQATGDLQQGIAAFYGKTNFYYSCQ